MHRILVLCNCDPCPQALEPLQKVGQIDYRPRATRAEVFEMAGHYDVVVCDAGIKFDQKMLAAAQVTFPP